MKKLIVSLVAASMLLTMIPAQANDTNGATTTATTSMKKSESPEVNALVARVNEINAMDKSSLSATEKTALRKELRGIKKEVNRRSGEVVYISGGLILLIILLIILL